MFIVGSCIPSGTSSTSSGHGSEWLSSHASSFQGAWIVPLRIPSSWAVSSSWCAVVSQPEYRWSWFWCYFSAVVIEHRLGNQLEMSSLRTRSAGLWRRRDQVQNVRHQSALVLLLLMSLRSSSFVAMDGICQELSAENQRLLAGGVCTTSREILQWETPMFVHLLSPSIETVPGDQVWV